MLKLNNENKTNCEVHVLFSVGLSGVVINKYWYILHLSSYLSTDQPEILGALRAQMCSLEKTSTNQITQIGSVNIEHFFPI